MSKPLLTEDQRKDRLKWAKDYLSANLDQVIFSNKTMVFLNHVKGRVWYLPGKKKVARIVKHPGKVNVWDCFSTKDFGRIICFKENLDAELMFDI